MGKSTVNVDIARAAIRHPVTSGLEDVAESVMLLAKRLAPIRKVWKGERKGQTSRAYKMPDIASKKALLEARTLLSQASPTPKNKANLYRVNLQLTFPPMPAGARYKVRQQNPRPMMNNRRTIFARMKANQGKSGSHYFSGYNVGSPGSMKGLQHITGLNEEGRRQVSRGQKEIFASVHREEGGLTGHDIGTRPGEGDSEGRTFGAFVPVAKYKSEGGSDLRRNTPAGFGGHRVVPVLQLGGRLRRDIETGEMQFDGHRWTISVQSKAPYSRYVEFVTTRTAAQPFLRPALARYQGRMAKMMQASMKEKM
jgi:hypothetical protein